MRGDEVSPKTYLTEYLKGKIDGTDIGSLVKGQ